MHTRHRAVPTFGLVAAHNPNLCTSLGKATCDACSNALCSPRDDNALARDSHGRVPFRDEGPFHGRSVEMSPSRSRATIGISSCKPLRLPRRRITAGARSRLHNTRCHSCFRCCLERKPLRHTIAWAIK
jgi:hypothetical protein